MFLRANTGQRQIVCAGTRDGPLPDDDVVVLHVRRDYDLAGGHDATDELAVLKTSQDGFKLCDFPQIDIPLRFEITQALKATK